MWMLRRLLGSRQLFRFHWRCGTRELIYNKKFSSTVQDYDEKPKQPTKPRVKESNEQHNHDEQPGAYNRSLFDPRYLAEVYREFYRELANAYAGFVNGFKKYK
ncbi:hypothetical protein ECG_05822 [Echinococcus granulosus]|nr:hypothetical protein ECG_05822 [Echinococcus granulosus]CDS18739.1 hypothetical protein EgrG_000657220 [Echinococcus granulosus]